MLSIVKINAAARQKKGGSAAKGYSHYLGAPTTHQRGDFDGYARGKDLVQGPPPFWACKAPALLGLDGIAEAEQVERLARGFHPLTGAPLVKGAGDRHVMGLDMTFSAPKDVSAIFAGADPATRAAVAECVQQAAKAALGYAEAAAVTRHGQGGREKQIAEAAAAACYTHFASRALEPHLHVHAFFFNAGKRMGSQEWSALEHRPQFERKMATGILFRAELAWRLKRLGFGIVPAGPYFAIEGISEAQRIALSSRSREIAEYMRETGMSGGGASAARDVAALNSRAGKAEPPLHDLLASFEGMAAKLGITPESVAAMRRTPAHANAPAAAAASVAAGDPANAGSPSDAAAPAGSDSGAPTAEEPPFSVDRAAVLDRLMASQSCATAQEALAIICEMAMGQWSAAECLDELERFLEYDQVVQLGRTELLTQVFTSQATKDLEESISRIVAEGQLDAKHRVAKAAVGREFDRLEGELRAKLGVEVSLTQQRKAALHVACGTGRHAFVEGWAGTGKTTMLKALAETYRAAGFQPEGCCQSAAASLNLAREAAIPSRTVASLLLSLREGRSKLGPKSILILDEAGICGAKDFSLLQAAATGAGAKLVCVGDPKQMQPIAAGGIFRSLMAIHGKAEISDIQRQRTDSAPLVDWLRSPARGAARLPKEKADALRGMPEDARMAALESLCSADPKLGRAFEKWRARYDFEWMREAVELFATGESRKALDMLDERGRLKMMEGQAATLEALISDWDADKTPLADKAIIAATRVEVAELNRLARDRLIQKGIVHDALGIDVEITLRDEAKVTKRFAPGDRIVFTLNDRTLGVVNGLAGTVREIERPMSAPILVVELDLPNARGERVVAIPASFGRFDLALCRTAFSSQGQTHDSAYVLANPSAANREWTYVAASRSRFATTLYANTAALGLVDPESHREEDWEPKSREAAIGALAARMRRSRAKGTSLDYADAPDISQEHNMLEADIGAGATPRQADIGRDAGNGSKNSMGAKAAEQEVDAMGARPGAAQGKSKLSGLLDNEAAKRFVERLRSLASGPRRAHAPKGLPFQTPQERGSSMGHGQRQGPELDQELELR